MGFVAAGAVLGASVAWSARLILAPAELADDASILAGLGVLLIGIVASVGLVLSRGPWARYLGLGLVATWLVLAAVLPLDAWGWVALGSAGVALLLLAGPWLDGFLRRLPPADAPPVAATGLSLLLAGAPLALGLSAPAGLNAAHWIAAAVCVAAAWVFSRAVPGAIVVVRILPPAALAVAAVATPLFGNLILGTLAVSAFVFAWRREAALAVNPLAPRPVAGLSVPSELVPRELLAAAGYDEHGRPKESE